MSITRKVFIANMLGDDDQATSSETVAPPALLPLRFLGMGLLIAWLCCTHLPDIYVSAWGEDARKVMDYSLRVGDVGTFAVVALLIKMAAVRRLSEKRRLCLVAMTACSACTAGMPLFASLGIAWVPMLALCGVAAGAGGAVLLLLWGEAYSRLGPSRSMSYGAGSCVAAGVVALLVGRMDPLAQNTLISILPLCSGACALASLYYQSLVEHTSISARTPSPGRSDDNHTSYPVPWKIVALMAFAGFASSFAGNVLAMQATHIGAVHRIVATVCVGFLVLAVQRRHPSAMDARVLAWATLPVSLVAIAAIPVLGYQGAAVVSFLVKLAFVMFTFFSLSLVASIAWRYEVPSDLLFSCARASGEGAMFLGILARQRMAASGMFNQDVTLWAITAVGVLAILGCVMLWHREAAVTSDWGTLGVDVQSGMHVPSRRELIVLRCDALARECGLTPRETEVLALVALGHPTAQVEEELFVSHNTLKTHLRHLYAKCEVHTREELEAKVLEGLVE